MNKCFCMIAVSIVCFCSAAHALTEVWHVALTNSSSEFVAGAPVQIIPDGVGGVACVYTAADTIETQQWTVILWLDAKGGQIYQTMQSSWNQWTVLGLDPTHLVYGNTFDSWAGGSGNSNGSGSSIVVVKSGNKTTATPINNCFGATGNMNWGAQGTGPLLLQNDKTGFFIIRYIGGNVNDYNAETRAYSPSPNFELVRFSYK